MFDQDGTDTSGSTDTSADTGSSTDPGTGSSTDGGSTSTGTGDSSSGGASSTDGGAQSTGGGDSPTGGADSSGGSTAAPASSPSTNSIKWDVQVIVQEQNPICWVASCAMVKGFQTSTSIGVGDFTGGFDPSNSCISNLAGDWQGCTDMMTSWGFTVDAVSDLSSGDMTAQALLSALQTSGPPVLLHMCSGFPYGSQHSNMTFKDTDAHAVVITGVDVDQGTATFNNPWGDKDQSCSLDTLVQKINADQGHGKTLGFYSGGQSGG